MATSRSSRVHSRHSSSKRRRSESPIKYKKKKKSDNSSSSSSSRESSPDKRHKRHKKHKKSKKSKKKSKSLSIGDQWGKYGIIYESDIFTKEPEFQAWLIEVKDADVETLSQSKRKEMFIEFMEDYNTATLPHKKFYSIEKWEKRQQAIRMGEQYVEETFDFAKDEERLRQHHKQAAKAAAASRQPALQLSEDQIKELSRVNRERIEADRMRKMGLTPKEGMGVRYEEVDL
ncbi:hypothetical protein CU097_005254 [Rhizopus azygosporus]|uniref:Uncharacterized protein n=1 Tax=Rhizopus azygosporus TaxID=86630 RepID=A0A367JBB9_RHIAZ|nr:hypothetical protein CU097_005254 [Rhizopus azygosporus]